MTVRIYGWLNDDEYAKLEEIAERNGLEPRALVTLILAKAMGTKVPKLDKASPKKLRSWTDERKIRAQMEGFRPPKGGLVDRCAEALGRAPGRALTTTELVQQLCEGRQSIYNALNGRPDMFERVPSRRKNYQPVTWRLRPTLPSNPVRGG